MSFRSLSRVFVIASASLCQPMASQASLEVKPEPLPSTIHLGAAAIDCLLTAMKIVPDKLVYSDLLNDEFSSVNMEGNPVKGVIRPYAILTSAGWLPSGITAGNDKLRASIDFTPVSITVRLSPSATAIPTGFRQGNSISYRLTVPKTPVTTITLYRGNQNGLPPSITGNDPFGYHAAREIADDAKACVDGRDRPKPKEKPQPLFPGLNKAATISPLSPTPWPSPQR